MNKIKTVTIMAVAIFLQACSTGHTVNTNQAIDPDGLFTMPGFHQVMITEGNKTIYIAGQVAYDKELNFVGMGDYSAQTVQALQNIALAVLAAGATLEDIVSSTFYIKGLNTEASKQIMAAMSVALDGKPFPAHAFNMIGVETLADPRSLIEISAIAVTHQ